MMRNTIAACAGLWLTLACSADVLAIVGCDGPSSHLTVVANTATIPESAGASAIFTFALSAPLGGDTPVSLQVSGTATNGTDYETLPTTVTIPFGQTQATLTLTPKTDATIEGAESVTVTITGPNGGCVQIADPHVATVSIIDGAGDPPVMTGAVSRKVHGAAGTFDLALNVVATNPTTEPRATGVNPLHTIVFLFDKPVIAGDASVTEGNASVGVPTFSGNEMSVPFTFVVNQIYVTVAATGVVAADGGTGGSGSIRLGFLLGDVSGNRVVTVADVGLVNGQVAQPVTAVNFLKDVSATGTLTVADKAIANAQVTKALPAP
jgi:hypothetical protein